MAAKIFRINYKSDFILTLNSDAGWMTPFCIKFWTGAPSQAFFAQWDGETYTHCAYDPSEPTKLLVQFDDHHLPIGELKYQVAYHFTVADFPNDTEDEVLNQANITTEIDGETYQVMLDFTGETAPEIEFSLPAYANEAQRIANEQQRITAETMRIDDEETRIANEQTRINQEQTRQQNEQQRINQEQARVNEYASLKADAVAATVAANDAAALANQKAQLAADKAALAQSAANLANAKAQLAADKAALAASAAQLANDKAALAQQKAEYAQAQGGYAKDEGDYAKDQGDYAKAQGDTALADHQRAESDHGIAVDDHTQAGNDHTIAVSDHGTAADDHTLSAADHVTASNDHTTATSDHGIAAADHTLAAADHAQAESDHTRAESDHAAVEVYVDSIGAYDISAANASGGVLATYADLTAALGTGGANIPELIRKGGMSVKFVSSSDNKYVQFRLMSQSFTTDVTQWQGVDDEPTAGSDNLVKSGGVALDIQKITGVIDKEFNLAVGETPSARTKTPCFFKSGAKVVGHVTDGTAVFDTEVTKQLVITFYRADGTTLISHSAIDAYTFTLSENAYFYALYAYKVITAGTVNVSLESTSSLLGDLINNVSFHSGEKLNSVDIENEVKENSAKLPKSGAVYASVDNNYKKEDLYRFAQLGVVSRYINITLREHSSTKDKVWVPITAGIYYVKVDLVTAVIGNNSSVSFHIFNDTTDKRSIPITLGEEKKITVSASEEGNSFGIYLYPVETLGDIFVSFKKEYNIPDDLKDVNDAVKEAQADIFKIKAETLNLSAEKSYEDSLFPVQYDSLGLVAKTGQILTVKTSTTGSLGYGWRLYGKKADGTYTKLIERWSASENTVTINEDYIDIATYVASGTNSGTATFNVKIENWHSDVDEALASIETNVDNLQTDVNKLMSGEIFIPSYFETQVASVIEKATSDIADAAINGDNFIFITDMHWENNSKKSPALIQRLCNEMTISKVIFGGDAINGQANKATAMSYFNAIAKGLKKAVSNFFSVLGNHDWNSQSGGSRFNTDGGVFYALLQKHSDFKMKYGSVAYFYFDDETTNTRYICIDSGPGLSFTSTQGDWIRSVLANTDNDMHIIFVIHGYMNMTVYQEGGEFAGYDYALSQAGTALNNIITNHISTKKIEAVISGHAHLDYNGMTSAMVPVIVTDCDAMSTAMWEATNGTITEQSFDVMTIDYTNKLITCRRVGRGKSRLIHYTPYTMSVGNTLDISSLLNITPTSYSIRDNMTFRYVDANSVPNKVVFYNNNATIDNSGVVTVTAAGYVTAVAENNYCIETFNIKIS